MDNFRPRYRERQARSAEELTRRDALANASSPPAFVGRIFAQSSVPTSTGRYFAVHPVTVLGAEGEANAGVTTVDTSTTVMVYVIGSKAPAAGDDVICRFIGSRWFAERMSTGQGKSTVALPGCFCTTTPTTLHMTVTNGSCNNGMFNTCDIVYGPTPSGYAGLALPANTFMSIQSFTDRSTGDSFRYYLFCSSASYTLTRVYLNSVFGSPAIDTSRYVWVINAPGNTCQPFLLNSGQIYTGGDPTCAVTISE